jgi:hypothetical protein
MILRGLLGDFSAMFCITEMVRGHVDIVQKVPNYKCFMKDKRRCPEAVVSRGMRFGSLLFASF